MIRCALVAAMGGRSRSTECAWGRAETKYDVTMSDSEVLEAEYRAFVKALHPASIDALIAVEDFWSQRIWPSIDRSAREGSADKTGLQKVSEAYKRTAGSRLLTLVLGHPDPDVRAAADELQAVLSTIISTHIYAALRRCRT